jgi:DNA-binding Xre family transcriptional regulator
LIRYDDASSHLKDCKLHHDRSTLRGGAVIEVLDDVAVEAWLVALGKRVRILRLTREMTQDDLAAAAGMSRSFVSLIEHGTHGIDVVRLLRLAAALEVALVDLLGSTPPDRRLPG